MRYEPDQSPPQGLAVALAAQKVALIISGIVLTPVIVLRAGGSTADLITWSIFMALLVSGITTFLQARPLGRLGAGYVLFMGTSGAFISVGVDALKAGGMALLGSLVLFSSLIQFVMAGRLSTLRRLVTPTVGGTTIMLIGVAVIPIAFSLLDDVPEPARADAPWAPFTAALLTFGVIVGLNFFGSRRIRLWSPLLGLLAGMMVCIPAGLVETRPFTDAAWVGLPAWTWSGLDLSFGPAFWSLLPAFIIVTLVGAIETYGDGIAIQKVSWRKPRAVDFRAVQGALYADALGNLLSGLGGTLPNTTYSTSISTVEMTGVAARRVGMYGGLLLCLLAFSPKVSALLLMVPNPVVGAYLLVLIVLLFMHGLQVALEDGFTLDKALVIGLSLWLGMGFQDQKIFPEQIPDWAAGLLGNGMVAGTLVAVLLTSLLQFKGGFATRLETGLAMQSLGSLQALARRRAQALHWDEASTQRVELALEEALALLVEHAGGRTSPASRLRVQIRTALGALEIELASLPLGVNLNDLPSATLLAETEPEEFLLGMRVLEAMVEDLRHQQYHGIDFLSFRVVPRERVARV